MRTEETMPEEILIEQIIISQDNFKILGISIVILLKAGFKYIVSSPYGSNQPT